MGYPDEINDGWGEWSKQKLVEYRVKRSRPKGSRFWSVWRKSGGGVSTKRHYTKDDAIKEGARLAKQAGEEFYILEVIGIVRPVDIPIEYEDFIWKSSILVRDI